MIIVTGSLLARADSLNQLLMLSLEHVRRSRTEAGCVSHAVHQDVESPLRLVFVEEWTDTGALFAHFAVSASREFIKAVRGLVAEPPTMNIYNAEAIVTDGQ